MRVGAQPTHPDPARTDHGVLGGGSARGLGNRWKRLLVVSYCCWVELDSHAELDVHIGHLLASSQGLVQALNSRARQEGQGERYEGYGG